MELLLKVTHSSKAKRVISCGAHVVFCSQDIGNTCLSALADAQIIAVSNISKEVIAYRVTT